MRVKGVTLMLVLSRKVDQEIVIDGNIKIRVLRFEGNRIRLGIEAPKNVHIRRGELPKQRSEMKENLEFVVQDHSA